MAEENHFIPRRSHKKSRQGCRNCKVRRIKCDETRPACTNCTKRHTACEYTAKERIRPVASLSPSLDSFTTESSPRTIETLGGDDNTFAPCHSDLELIYHYTSHTSQGLGGGQFWGVDVPTHGFRDPCLMHLILTVSGFHLAYEHPERKDEARHHADFHYSQALGPLISKFEYLDKSNARLLYMSAVLVCFINVAKGPVPGEYLAFSDSGSAEWLALLNGVKVILSHHNDVVFPDGPSSAIRGSACLPVSGQIDDFDEPLSKLQSFIACLAAEEPSVSKYSSALDHLQDMFVARHRSVQDSRYEKSQVVFSWLFSVEMDYFSALWEKKPLALVIYAHFAVLLKDLESIWFMRGWTHQIMAGVVKHLHSDFRHWIEWPCEKVGYPLQSHGSPV